MDCALYHEGQRFSCLICYHVLQFVDRSFLSTDFRCKQMFFKTVFPLTGLLDLLCPPVCPVCSGLIEDSDEPFCSTCIQKIVTPVGHFCLRCGGRRFVSPNSNTTEGCPRCRTTTFRFKRVIALGEYERDLRLLVLRMKTDRTGILAISAAQMLATARCAEWENVQADYVVPVPMHYFRREDRGVNSPDILAEELARQLNIPLARHIVQRIRRTDLQYTLSRQARAENVKDAFALRPPGFWQQLVAKSRGRIASQSPDLSSKNILLVDDIFTTGATCNEITKVLLSAGARSVAVAVLARAEGMKGIANHV